MTNPPTIDLSDEGVSLAVGIRFMQYMGNDVIANEARDDMLNYVKRVRDATELATLRECRDLAQGVMDDGETLKPHHKTAEGLQHRQRVLAFDEGLIAGGEAVRDNIQALITALEEKKQ